MLDNTNACLSEIVENFVESSSRPVGDENAGGNFADDAAVPPKDAPKVHTAVPPKDAPKENARSKKQFGRHD